jgi:hypothetical protein
MHRTGFERSSSRMTHSRSHVRKGATKNERGVVVIIDGCSERERIDGSKIRLSRLNSSAEPKINRGIRRTFSAQPLFLLQDQRKSRFAPYLSPSDTSLCAPYSQSGSIYVRALSPFCSLPSRLTPSVRTEFLSVLSCSFKRATMFARRDEI